MSSTGSATPVVPHWATSLLGGSKQTTPNTPSIRQAPSHILKTVETPTISTTDSPSEVLPVEMDDENDVDYEDNSEEADDNDGDGEEMDDTSTPGLVHVDTPASMDLVQESSTTSAGLRGQNTIGTPSTSHAAASGVEQKVGMTQRLAAGTHPVPRAVSVSSSSGGSDIPDVLPSYRRGTSGTSTQATAETSAPLKRGATAEGGPAFKRPRVSNIAHGVITSRLDESDSSVAPPNRRRSDAAKPGGVPDGHEPAIAKVESDVGGPGDATAAMPNSRALASVGISGSSKNNHPEYFEPPEHITMTEDGRPYTCMPGFDPSTKTKGALFPTGYQLRLEDYAPYICPVRDCQTRLPTVKGLGSHVTAKHAASLFNDNLDGTMSFIRTYIGPPFPRPPPLIISRYPPGPDELPPRGAFVSANVTMKARKRGGVIGIDSPSNLYPSTQGITEGYQEHSTHTVKNTHTPRLDYGLRMPTSEYSPASVSTPVPQQTLVWQSAPVPQSYPVQQSLPVQEYPPAPDNAVQAPILEMESWEVAPGHIRDGKRGDPHENVAFSNAYMTSNAAIPISPHVGFNVATIRPGGSYKLEENPRVLRVCSVASGKVYVKLDEKKFPIGCNGVFKIRGGSTASVENRLSPTCRAEYLFFELCQESLESV